MIFEERESQLSFGARLLEGRSTILQGMLSDPSVYRLYDVNYDQHAFYVCMKFPKISKNITFKGYSMNTEEVNHRSMSYIKKCSLSLLC